MKIVFLSYLHGFGGAEKQNVMLANSMVDKGHDVTLISICANNICYELDSRIKYIFLPDRVSGPLRIVDRFLGIRKILNEIKPDITVNFWFQSAYMTALMKKSIVGKVIYSERGDPGDKEYSGALGLVRKIVLPRIDGFVFQSNGAQNYFNDRVKERSVVIPNPVFIDRNNYPSSVVRKKRIITVGRLHPQKNHKLLIDSFALIASMFPDYSLEIYGDGELKNITQEYINEKKMGSQIKLMGTSKEIYNEMFDASVFVLSSDYEGLPNTLIEAMALGIPCISTDCKPGGARDIITHKEDGIIVPRNNPERMSEAIKYLLSNPDKSERMAAKASENMKKFQPGIVYDKWETYFGRVLGESK